MEEEDEGRVEATKDQGSREMKGIKGRTAT